jgi:hypothetical protein
MQYGSGNAIDLALHHDGPYHKIYLWKPQCSLWLHLQGEEQRLPHIREANILASSGGLGYSK